MNNILILCISIIILTVLFLMIIIIIGKNKINEIVVPLELSNDKINELLKQKYKVYKEMIKLIKSNLSIKEDSFLDFSKFNEKECTQEDLIDLLDKTTIELDNYVNNYNEILKNNEFLELKYKLFDIQVSLEGILKYYNNKINLYNKLKTNGPTSFASKFFVFDKYDIIENDNKDIDRFISLN